jgi:hypothetical protein
MQNLMTKLTINFSPEGAKSEGQLPCGMIGAQNDPKISFY